MRTSPRAIFRASRAIALGVVMLRTPCFAGIAIEQAIRVGDTADALIYIGSHCSPADDSVASIPFKAAMSTELNEDEQLEIVSKVLSCGVDVNTKTPDGATALWPALRTKHTRMAMLLISKGARVNEADSTGVTPLHLAVGLEQSAELVEEMLAKGADPDARDLRGMTPFLIAVHNGNQEAAALLVGRGVSVKEADKFGNTALHLLASATKDEVAAFAEFLIAKGADVNAKAVLHPFMTASVGALTPLHLAAMSNRTKFGKVLLDHGANVNAVTDEGATPLMLALSADHLDFAEALVKQGADVNLVSDRIHNPAALFSAVRGRRVNNVRLLLENHADPNVVSLNQGENVTALHMAAASGSVEIVQLLLMHGAHVDARDESGMTPLWVAAISGYREIVEVLIAAGADVNAKNGSGSTVLDRAHDPEVRALLSAHHASESSPNRAVQERRACDLVVAKANAGPGRWQDTLGDFVPEEDFEHESLPPADSWRTVIFGGRKYVLGLQADEIRYLARTDAGSVHGVVCELEDKPVERIVEAKQPKLCSAVQDVTVTYATYDHIHALRPGALQGTSIGEKAARIDLDNDGSPDYVVELHLEPLTRHSCGYSYLGVLNETRTELDSRRNQSLLASDSFCGTKASPFVYEGETYIEIMPDSAASDGVHSVVKLQGDSVHTICEWRIHRLYSVRRLH
jgi:ankyrin repeat protein